MTTSIPDTALHAAHAAVATARQHARPQDAFVDRCPWCGEVLVVVSYRLAATGKRYSDRSELARDGFAVNAAPPSLKDQSTSDELVTCAASNDCEFRVPLSALTL